MSCVSDMFVDKLRASRLILFFRVFKGTNVVYHNCSQAAIKENLKLRKGTVYEYLGNLVSHFVVFKEREKKKKT